MVPKKHILFGFIFSLLILLIFKFSIFSCTIIFLSSFLIDVDHYFYFVFKKKNLNPKKAVKFFFSKKYKMEKVPKNQRKNYYTGFYFLHGIETLALMFILGKFVSPIFFLIFIGFSFHLLLDWFEEISHEKRIDKISLIYDLLKFRRLKEIE